MSVATNADEPQTRTRAATVSAASVERPTRVTFLIPAFNEARTIGEVLRRVAALGYDAQAIVVDDGSTDTTPDVAEREMGRLRGCVIRQQNRGKGAALRAAIPYIDGDIVVIQDADMEYDPADVPRLIEPIVRGMADVVYGSRLSGGQPQRAYMFWHLVGNRFLSLATNVLFNTTLSDMETGYKAFRADVFRSLRLRQNDFRIEPEITSQICLRKLRVYEIPIAYYGRTYEEGKKITWKDGFGALGVLVTARFEAYLRRSPAANTAPEQRSQPPLRLEGARGRRT